MAIDVLVVTVGLVLTCPLEVPLPLLLYLGGGGGYKEGNRVDYNMISIRTLSLLAYFTYIFYRYNYLCLGKHVMVLWILPDGGPSHSRPLLGPYKSMWGGTLGTNPRQQPSSA
jgi:hypothetical protein